MNGKLWLSCVVLLCEVSAQVKERIYVVVNNKNLRGYRYFLPVKTVCIICSLRQQLVTKAPSYIRYICNWAKAYKVLTTILTLGVVVDTKSTITGAAVRLREIFQVLYLTKNIF